MANLDINQGYSQAKSKISAYQTVKQSKEDDKKQQKEKTKASTDKKKSEVQKSINDLKKGGQDKKNQIKNEIKSQLEQLLELFKATLPSGGGSSLKLLTNVFLQAATNTKSKIQETLVSEIVSTIGCSEEQSYGSVANQPIYIKVNQVDLFKILKNSPDDEDFKYQYEKNTTNNGSFPYAMNQQLYKRLQNPSQSFSQDNTGGNGQTYQGASQSQIFDIQYVQNYLGPNNLQVTGDFFKVTLNNQANNRTSVTDFLQDYYTSIDIMPFDNLSVNLKNLLTGSFDFSAGLSSDELKEQSKFMTVLKRIMGICEDPNKKIDVAGTSKLSDIDEIDDSFFDVTNQELMVIEQEINNTIDGVVEFEGCEGIKLPIDVLADRKSQDEIINENSNNSKIEKFEKSLEDIANDPKWKSLIPGLGLDLNLLASLQSNIILGLPRMILKTILSPKVMLGFLIMVKAIKNEISEKLDDLFDDLTNFMKTFKKFILNFMKKITSIFVEELFNILKKQIKVLVETILLEVVKEAKNKQISMYASIVYILLVIGQAVVDFRNCKSVIDEILKLLNLGLSQLNLGLPQFILAGASLLGGVSDTRAFSNVIENLQKQGLPTGAAPDGGPNLMNMSMMSMVKGMNQEQAENGKTEVFIPPLTITPAGITLPSKGVGKSY
jgi:hypothetical protein